jgi:hypothetical protein
MPITPLDWTALLAKYLWRFIIFCDKQFLPNN